MRGGGLAKFFLERVLALLPDRRAVVFGEIGAAVRGVEALDGVPVVDRRRAEGGLCCCRRWRRRRCKSMLQRVGHLKIGALAPRVERLAPIDECRRAAPRVDRLAPLLDEG